MNAFNPVILALQLVFCNAFILILIGLMYVKVCNKMQLNFAVIFTVCCRFILCMLVLNAVSVMTLLLPRKVSSL